MTRSRIQIAGVEVDVTRKKMKNLRLVVQAPEGAVRLSAPARVSKADIVQFVSANIAWIKDQQRLIAERDYPKPPSFCEGELHPHWGEKKPLRFLPYSRRNMAFADEDAIYLAHKGPSSSLDLEQREHLLFEFYRQECALAIPPLVQKYSCAYGVEVKQWRLRRMKTRWGTCNIGAARIWLNTALAAYAPSCLEYVVVHETAHLLEASHNSRFWRIVESQYPDWRAARAHLNAKH